jgi:hypothetical protein
MDTAMSHLRSRAIAYSLAGLLAGAGGAIALVQSAQALASPTPSTASVPTLTTTTTTTTTSAPSGATSLPGIGGTGAATTPTFTLTQSTSPARAQTGTHRAGQTSTGAIVIAALAALLALGCVAWAIARLTAFEPRWTQSLRHALGEAGFRASATWAEFSDWVRLGH